MELRDHVLEEELRSINNTLDAIAEKCEWNKMNSECGWDQLKLRARYKQYLKRASNIEMLLGL